MTHRTTALLICFLLPPAAAQAAIIAQTANDAAGTNSFVTGTNFPGGAPTAGNDYVDAQYLMRTPETGTSYTFQGNSLTLGNGTSTGTLFYKGSDNSTITINNLIANNAAVYQVSNTSGVTMTLAGAIDVQAGGLSLRPQGSDSRNRYMIVTASIGGSGPVTIYNPGGNDTSGTSAAARLSSTNNTYSGGTTLGDELSDANTDRISLTITSDSSLGSGGVVNVLANGTLKLQGTGNLGIGQSLWLDNDLATLGGITLDYSGTASIAALSFDGGATFVSPGTYGADGSGAEHTSGFFSGTGTITVVPEPGMIGVMAAAGLLIRRRRSRQADHQ